MNIENKISTNQKDDHRQSLRTSSLRIIHEKKEDNHDQRLSLPMQLVNKMSSIARSSVALQLIQTVTDGVSKSKNKTRTLLLFLFSVTVSTVLGGLIYGFPALRSNLLKEGSTLTEEELGLIFTVGTAVQLVASLIIGLLRDKFGTRKSVLLSMISALCGSLGLAFCSPNSVWQLSASLVMIELGSGAQICVFPVAELFDNPGVVMGLLSGCFNLSAMLFPMFFAISKDRRLCIGGVYAALIGLLCIAGYLLLPTGLSFLLDEDEDEGSNQDGKLTEVAVATSTKLVINERESLNDSDPLDTDKVSVSAIQQMKSIEYICIVAWFVVSVVPLQFYAGSIAFQLEEKGDNEGRYVSLFSIFYAASPVFSPVGGFLSDHFGAGFTQGVAIVMSFTPFLLLLLGGLSTQIIGMISYSLGRTLIFAIFYAYIGTAFGYDNMGALAGTGSATSALFSLIQYPMINAASSGSENVVNMICAAFLVSTLPYSIWLGSKEVTESKKRALRQNDVEGRKGSIHDVDDLGDLSKRPFSLRHSAKWSDALRDSTISRRGRKSLSGSFSSGTESFPVFH